MQQVPIGKVIVWIPLWPLIYCETVQGQIAEAVEHVRELIGPTQQPQPASVAAELEAAIQASERSDEAAARAHITKASEFAREWGYV
jgi:hypothetical protein